MNATVHLRKMKRTPGGSGTHSPQPSVSTVVKTAAPLPSHLWKSSSLTALKLPPLTKSRPTLQPIVPKRPPTPKKRSSVPVPLVHPPDKPTIEDFRLMRIVGTGTFSRVRLAQSRRTQEFVVIKVMRKADIVKMRQVEHVKNEKGLLERITHPFIVNLKHSFQDRTNLYLVLDYVPGGELFRLLRLQVQFPVLTTRFYASEVVSALAYLHNSGVVYRDLKPENLLLTQTGHVKITDFGFAKGLKEGEKAYTLCGTPEYLAPEVIQQRGHDCACDWWGVGILIYEMTCGHAPFLDPNPYKLYEKIINNAVAFPDYFDPTLQTLVEALLDKDVKTRIDQQHILTHPFFASTDWAKVAACGLTPPYLPHVRTSDDTSNFDDYPEEVEPMNLLPVAADLFANF